MSVFKTIGTKVKRLASLKNVINAVSGNYAAVGKEALRVASTKAPAKKGVTNVGLNASEEQTIKAYEIPTTVQQMLNTAGAKQAKKTSQLLANTPFVQDNLDTANKFALSVWWDATWLKYKHFILAGLALIAVFIGWKVLGKKSGSRGRARR